MTFNQFKAALKRVIRSDQNRICYIHSTDDALWIGSGTVLFNCSMFQEIERAMLRIEIANTARYVRELNDSALNGMIARWGAGERKRATETRVRYAVDDKAIVLCTSKHGVFGVQQLYLDMAKALTDRDAITLDWGGLSTPLRIMAAETLLGFIAPFNLNWGEVRSEISAIIDGLPTEVSS